MDDLRVQLRAQRSEEYCLGVPVPSPMNAEPDPEIEALKSELTKLKLEKRLREAAGERRVFEQTIREDAERKLKLRMEENQRHQEEAKKEIGLAKIAAERAARERLEEDSKAEEERLRRHEGTLARVEREAREKIEKEALERKRRSALRGLFNRPSQGARPSLLNQLKGGNRPLAL